jgi:hypothetical protein
MTTRIALIVLALVAASTPALARYYRHYHGYHGYYGYYGGNYNYGGPHYNTDDFTNMSRQLVGTR